MTDDRAEQLAHAIHGSEEPFWIRRMSRVLAAIDADPETYGYQRAAKRLTFETREEMFAWLAAEDKPLP